MGGVADAAAVTVSRPVATPSRSQLRLTLRRFGRDRWSVAAACVFVLILFASFFGGVIIALLIGLPIGAMAGYFGGVADWLVSRFTETVMAFPLIFFLVFASVRLDATLTPIGWGQVFPKGVFAEALLIGVFTSFYP